MKTIDKYILKKFLSTFLFVVIILNAIIVVIDITEKNEKFIKNNLSFEQISGYYLDFIPYVSNLITPITVFIATVFVTAKLASHTEIIAILSSGISFRRMMLPYMIGAILIACASFFLTGWVIPNSNKTRLAFEIAYFKSTFYYDNPDTHIKVAPKTYLYIKNYNNQANVAYNITLETLENTQLKEKLTAQKMEWQPEKENWKVSNWQLRKIEEFKEVVTEGQELDTTLSISPKDFSSNYNLQEALTIDELNEKIQELRDRGADDVGTYMIEKYIRFMSPFTVLILTFIGLIVSARKVRGGAGFQIALGFLIAFIFIIFFIMSKSIAQAGTMDPLFAVWLPNIVFSIVGIVMYKTVPR